MGLTLYLFLLLLSVFFLIKKNVFIYMHVSVCMYDTSMWVLVESGEGVRFPGTRVMGGYKLRSMGAGNEVWPLWKSSIHS